MDQRTRWIVLGLIALVGIGFLFAQGQGRSDADEEPSGPVSGEATIPMPDPAPQESPTERARGLYILTRGNTEFTLDLQRGGQFRFVSSRDGKPVIASSGTWSLVGSRLTLTYTSVPGKPEISEKSPEVVHNVWRGRSVQLLNTGLKRDVILTKRTALRQR